MQRKHSSQFYYDNLEPKQMLATILSGSDADDILRIEFTQDPQIVQVRLNEQPQQLIDVADLELRIDLLQGDDVVIFENSQNSSDELTRILIQSAETIQASDSDNHWLVFDQAFSSIDGVLNNHIQFAGADELIGGAERDEFRIRSFGRGSIHGGAGDDLFVFGRNLESNFGVVYGGDGDDQFVVRGSNILEIRGGDGIDRLSLRNSELSAIHVVAEVSDEITWHVQNQLVDVDRIIGRSNGPNLVQFVIADDLTEPVQPNETAWVINGAIARSLIDSDVTTFVNFRRFEFITELRDSVFVRSTAYNLTFDGPDFLQLSSELDPSQGNLDQINHRIHALAPPLNLDEPVPRIVLSQQSGAAANFVYNNFDSNNDDCSNIFSKPISSQLRWNENGGRLQFTRVNFQIIESRNFQVQVFGSMQSDRFFVRGEPARGLVVSQFQIFGMDGNDRFQVIDTATTSYEIDGGQGLDNVVVDDRSNPIPFLNSLQEIRDYRIEDSSVRVVNRPTSDFFARQLFLTFTETVEDLRILGGDMLNSSYSIVPSTDTRISIEASTEQTNELFIVDPTNTASLSNLGENSGLWQVPGRKGVFFSGIQETGIRASSTTLFSILDFIGLSLEEAEELAVSQELGTRLAELDGEKFPLTTDYNINRVNFTVVDNFVVKAIIG